MKQAHRFSGKGKAYEGLTKMSKGGPVWTGKVSLHPELLDWPLRKRKPSRIFVNSMSDLFHEDVPDDFIRAVWCTMFDTPQHTYQILTKRPRRMLEYLLPRLSIGGIIAKPLDNVWLGVSVEDQARADERIPLLLQTPAAVRWISAEPLIGPVDLTRLVGGQLDALAGDRKTSAGEIFAGGHGLDWVVVGGESGPGARPFYIEWARSLRDQCRAAGVPYFLKQLGSNCRGWCAWHAPEHIGIEEARRMRAEGNDGDCDNYEASEQAQPCSAYGRPCVMLEHRKGGDPAEWPEDLRVREYPA
jgi:protein gp37